MGRQVAVPSSENGHTMSRLAQGILGVPPGLEGARRVQGPRLRSDPSDVPDHQGRSLYLEPWGCLGWSGVARPANRQHYVVSLLALASLFLHSGVAHAARRGE
jgi:hypothetical protein